MEKETVNSPAHYNIGNIEVIDAIEDWQLNFSRGNAVKYIARAGHKDKSKEVEDLKKARWYLDREIKRLEKKENLVKEKDIQQVYAEIGKTTLPEELEDDGFRTVCIQATPSGAAVLQGCNLKAHKD